MKTFRNLAVLKRPQQELWTAMRDHLADFAGQIADIDEIRQIDRSTNADGTVHIVNEWRVRQSVPATVRSALKTEELIWIDRNNWDAATYTCAWAIEPNFLTEHITCFGTTSFASAMAGQGTRVTFEGQFDLKPEALGSLGGMDTMLFGSIESIVATIIPRNLRAVADAAAAFDMPKE